VQEQLIGALRRALIPALTAAALPAHALVLGEIEIRSALGEALDARIAIEQLDGQVVDASCFSLVRDPGAGLPSLAEGILTVERTGPPALRIRTLGGVYEPAVTLRVRAACPGQSGYMLRQYSLLLDPRPGMQVVTAPPVVERAMPGAAAEGLAATTQSAGAGTAASQVATLNARSGDTLRSIASAVFPRNRRAQAQYLAALREANPSLAAQPDAAPLPEGAAIALPDLRTYARAAIDASRPAPRARAARPAPEVRAQESSEAAPQRLPRARAETSAPVRAPASARAPAAAAARGGESFVLKLSSSEVDLNRSRAIDDRVRAQLRERLLVLDSDDQVSALLAMRNSLRQLEGRVTELQLKLAQMPANLPSAPTKPVGATTPAPAVAAESAAARSAEPVASPPPAAAVPPADATPAPGPVVQPQSPAATTPPAAAAPPAAAPAETVVQEQPSRTRPKPRQATRFELSPWLWGLVALLTALALLLAWSLRRRKLEEEIYEYDQETVLAEPEPEPAAAAAAPEARREPRHPEPRAPRKVEPVVGALSAESSQMRRRYIEERFPEVASRTIVLGDADSVVKAARLFYQDGALARAVELLQFAIEENPAEVRLWLALFEVFRLEGLTREFAALAGRFRERHENSGYWAKVQYIGRELEPGNALYRDDSFNKLETIGPSASRRLAASTFDPVAENWLNAPMDFQNQVLASELRRSLMVRDAVAEQDLVPNPMPALRNVEMYTLA